MIAASAPAAMRAKPQNAASVTRRLSRGRSNPHEGLREAAPETLPAQFALHGDKADAFLARLDARLVLHCLLSEVKVARAVAATGVTKGAAQNAGHFERGMLVSEQSRVGRNLQEKDFVGLGSGK